MPEDRKPRGRIVAARAIAAAILALPACWLIAGDRISQDRIAQDPEQLVFVTAHWRDRAQLNRIASHFQHLDVDERRRTARMEASADELRELRRMGVRYEIDDAATTLLHDAEAQLAVAQAIPGYSCYRTVEETWATMDVLASLQPTIAQVVDIGPTWEWQRSGGTQGHRMRVLRTNNPATDARYTNKANVVVLSAIHAREYTTAEVATRFAEWLIGGYGIDPEATWMLDAFRFHFILQGNPDGRKKAESGLLWRKNTNSDNGNCSPSNYGVDLNRNWTWRWSLTPNGSSSNPCASNYRGPAAVSEPETQNTMRYVVGTRGSNGVYAGGALPDRRTDTGAAPTNYNGLFLDLHSAARLVLWPWSNTSATSPNHAALRTLGRRIAYFNGYQPKQWIGLYPADGTNTDTVYGITGAPSYTIEMGQAFFESCSTFETTTYPRNLDALRYAARVAQNPYLYAGGPDTTSVAQSATSVRRGQRLGVSAWVDDARYQQNNGVEPIQNVASARAYIDVPPWVSGASVAMQASDGAFNSPRELVSASLSTTNLAPGPHRVFMRGVDAAGQLGPVRAVFFQVTP
jgi:hypothetical protein